MDRCWWNEYQEDAAKKFDGFFATGNIDLYGVDRYNIHAGNSGAGAILLARKLGAEKIILIGFDCAYTDGKKHWHGDHPKTLANAGSINAWPAQFEKVKGDDIVNCSRSTALKTFKRSLLEDEIQCHTLS